MRAIDKEQEKTKGSMVTKSIPIKVPGCCDGKCYSPSDTKPSSLRGRPVLQDGFLDDVAGLGNCASCQDVLIVIGLVHGLVVNYVVACEHGLLLLRGLQTA